jgi:hypothetical protein
MKPDRPYLWSLPLALCLAVPSRAQQAAGPVAPEVDPRAAQAVRDAGDVLQELRLTRAFAAARLTPGQATQLASVLEQAQARLAQVDAQEAAAVNALKTSADQARQEALSGKVPPTTVDTRYANALALYATRRRHVRDELVVILRGQLNKTLRAEQLTALEQASEAARLASSGAAMPGGGPAAGLLRALDALRDIPVEQWPQARPQVAAQLAGFGRPFGRLGGPPGAAPAAPDPATQQQLARTLALVDRVHAMSPQEYEQARPGLASQLSQQVAQQMARARGEDVSPEGQLNRFIDESLLHPLAPGVLRRRAASNGG